MRWTLALLSAGLAAGTLTHAGGADVQPIRATVEAVRVEFVATGSKGAFVDDLDVREVSIKDNGRTRPVATFELVRGRDRAIDTERTTPRDGREACRTAVVVVLDELNVSAGGNTLRTRHVARQFVDQFAPRLDCVGVVTTGEDSLLRLSWADFSSEYAAIDRFTGRKATAALGGGDRDADSRSSLRTLQHFARTLQATETARRAVLFVSEGVLAKPTESSALGAELKLAMEAAAAAAIAVYPLDPRMLGAAFDDVIGFRPSGSPLLKVHVDRWSLREWASFTGGRAMLDSNDFPGFFDQLVADATDCYVLGFYPAEPPKPGFHRLDVKVARRGVKVLARRGYHVEP